MTDTAAETTELESPPSFKRLYAQAVAAPLLPGGDAELPARRLVLRGVEVERDAVAAYAHVCGFALKTDVPGTYPHVLAFPVHLELMTGRTFPFSILGLVHIANRIEVAAPIPVGARLDMAVQAEDLRPHRRGRQFDLVTEALLDGQVAWRSTTTYLHRESGNGNAGDESPDQAPEPALDVAAEWKVPGDIGRRYAAVSGDRNPIHMHPLSARLFGFPSAIAHGMWTKARCLAAFDGRLGEAYSIQVEFKAPLRVPGSARLLSGQSDGGWRFRVEGADGERVHVRGAIA